MKLTNGSGRGREEMGEEVEGEESDMGLDDDEVQEHNMRKSEGRATMTSSISNLCNTIIGTGMLATPGAFRYTGLLPGIFLIVLCGFTAMAGLLLLTLCADTLGGRRNSFFSIAIHTIPRGARVFDAAIATKVREHDAIESEFLLISSSSYLSALEFRYRT
jgi:hypothetical protein